MTEQRTCGGCGKAYWHPAAFWQHRACMANALFKSVANASPDMANTVDLIGARRRDLAKQREGVDRQMGAYLYRDADKRREYQRGLMQVRRAVKSGRACEWPPVVDSGGGGEKNSGVV